MNVFWGYRVVLGALLCLGWLSILAQPAYALVEGTTPKTLKTYRVFGGAVGVGNTLMSASPPGNVNDILLPQSSARITGLPFDAKLTDAYVWWTGSIDGTVDRTVDFTLANGQKVTVTASAADCQSVQSQGGFFYCRANIKNLIDSQGGGVIGGTYTLGGVKAKPGNCNTNPRICQARYAAWSMVVVWESPTFTIRRDIVLYDGFLHMDEQPSGSGITSFTLQGFKVGNPPQGTFTYFGLEGDEFLGSPPEPSNHADFIRFRSNTSPSGTRLSSATPHNPPGNIWNSTIALGVDLDTFNIGQTGLNLIKPGDSSAQIVLGTGDGIVPDGNGESVFMGYVLVSIDTLSPNFRNRNTNKRVDKLNASVGNTLTYTLRVTNSGSLEGKNVVVQDSIPANTSYIPNSTRVDGKLVTDVGGTSALVNGINLGTIDFRGDNDREITFQVRITGTPASRSISNTFTVRADDVGSTTSNTVVTTLRAPQLGRFTKTAKNLTTPNGPYRPGDTITYEIEATNVGGSPAPGVRFTDDLPKFVKLIAGSVFFSSGTNQSSATGGANGTGRIVVDNMTIPVGTPAKIAFSVRIFTEAEFVAAGISADQIDGQLISNQGEGSVPSVAASLKTDDPTTPPRNDPTVVTVSYKPDFTTSTKTVKDDNGGRAEPGDQLTYTVTLKNTGTKDTTVSWIDPLPLDVDNFNMVSSPSGSKVTFTPGSTTSNPKVAGRLSITGITLARGATQTIVFTVKIAQNVANATPITNIGTVQDEKSPLKLALSSQTLVVVAGPILATSSKTVTDVNGGQIAPNDVLRYTIRVANTGNRPATDVVIEDPIDSNLEQVTPANGGQFANGKITWNKTTTPALASIAPGATVTLTFTAKIKASAPDGTAISNQANITTPGLPNSTPTDDPSTPKQDDATAVLVVAKPALASTKTFTDANGAPARPGDTINYTIVVRNTGTGAATDIIVSDPLNSNLINVTPGQGGRFQNGTIVWDKTTTPALASLLPGASTTLTFSAQLRNPYVGDPKLSNQASIVAKDVSRVVSDDPNVAGTTDPTIINVQLNPQPKISKVVRDLNGGDAVPGDTLQYTITIQGGGDTTLADVIVEDAIDSNLDQITPGQGGQFANGKITWNKTTTPALATLSPTQTATLTFTARVKAGTADQTTINNQADVKATGIATTFKSDDPSKPGTQDITSIVVRSRADLSQSTKTVADINGGQVLPGDTLSYTITIRNTGNVAATNVRVIDAIQSDLVSPTPGQGGRIAGANITWDRSTTATLASIAPGASVTLSFTAQVKSPIANGTVIKNQATIQSDTSAPAQSDDPSTPTVGDSTDVTVVSGPTFAETTKAVEDVNGGKLVPGDTVRYTIVVKNTGTDVARQVKITDKVDTTKLTSVTPGQGGRFAAGTITWDATTTPALATMAVNGDITLTFTATVISTAKNGDEIANQAFVSSQTITTPEPSDDPRTNDKDDTTKINVVAGSDLSDTTKSVTDNNGGSVQPGDTLTYTIVVKNTGTGVAANVVVTDKIDSNLDTINPGQGGQFANGTITWNTTTTPALASIAQNGQVTLTFTARVVPGTKFDTEINNQAEAKASDLPNTVPSDDPSTTALDDPTTVKVGGNPVLTATKAASKQGGGNYEPGDTVTYTIVVKNGGNRPATNVTISDSIDTNLENITPQNGGTFNSTTRQLLWNIPTIAAGGSATVTFTARIKQGLFNGVAIDNQANVTSAEVTTAVPSDDPSTPAAQDATRIVIQSEQKLIFTKTASFTSPLRPGDTVLYTLKVDNQGRTPLAQLTVTDPIDPNLENIQTGQGGQFANGTVTWSPTTTSALGQLNAGQSVTLTFRARVKTSTQDGTVIKNQGTLKSAGQSFTVFSDDPSTAATGDSTNVTVSFPNLSGSTKEVKDLNGGTFEPGDTVEYTITLRNTSSSPVRSVTVTDKVDTTNLETITPGQGGQLSGDTITWTAARFAALARVEQNSPVVLTFTAKIKANVADKTVVSNQAIAKSSDLDKDKLTDDPSTQQAEDPTNFEVLRAPNLTSFTKEAKDAQGKVITKAKPGDALTYTITLTNNGSRPATNVTITDPIDTQLTSVVPDQGGQLANGTITWNATTTPALASIAPGQSVTLSFKAVIDPQTTNGYGLRNQASVTSTEITTAQPSDDPSVAGDQDPTIVTVGSLPTLATSTKAVEVVGGGAAQAGSTLRYTIRVINSGAASAFQVRLRDTTPQFTEYVANSLRLNGTVVPGSTNPLENGLFVNSPRAGTPQGVILANDGAPPNDEVAVVTFDVKIKEGTPLTAVIENVGILEGRDLPPVNTNAVKTTLNGGPLLDDTDKQVRIVEDKQTQGVADPGDTLEYTITIRNSGEAANNLVFRDAIPDNSKYVTGSITVDGNTQTDNSGDDEAEFQAGTGPNGTLFVRRTSLAKGGSMTITFRVTIEGGDLISNQGTVNADKTQAELTDADRDDANGDQPTEIPVGKKQLITATKQVFDVNGGDYNPGDVVEYRITVTNSGLVPLASIKVTDVMPTNMTFVQDSAKGPGTVAFDENTKTLTFSDITLDPSASATVLFRAKIADGVSIGTRITNVAKYSAPQVAERDAEVSFEINNTGRNTTLEGLVFQDYGAPDTNYDANFDEVLADFKIKLFRPDNLQTPVKEGVSGQDGKYSLSGVPSLKYKLRYYTSNDVQFGEFDIDLSAGGTITRNIIVQPTGRVFNSESGVMVQDASVYVVDSRLSQTICKFDKDCPNDGLCVRNKLSDADGKCASKIDSTKMLENQQGQKTNALGMYKFTLPVSAFAYRIVVRPGDPSLAFPSDKLRFQSQTAKYDAAKSGQIVTQAKPNLQNQQESRDYHVTFSVEEEGKVIQNNHIPLDFWRNLLILTKKASKRVATVGDIITYTLTLENRSPAELKYDPKTKLGGIYFTDILPRGFRLLPLSVKMTRADGKVVLPIAKPLVTTKDGKRQETLASRLLRYGPFTLPGQSTLTLRYQTVVKPNLPIGQYVNIAYVHNEAGTALSEQAKAVVQVSYDPIFDQGTVLGKVFCDKNSNRKQEATDVGIQGVRLYLDNGHYAVTDMFGKYHIQGIDPGNHLLKIDKQTLPPGSKLIDTPYQIFYTTRGLVRKINYAVSCRSATSGIQKVMLTNKKAIQLGYKKKIIPPKPLTLKGSVYGPRLTLNGSQRALPVSNLAVSKPNDLGDYSPNAAPDFPTKKGRLTHPLVFHIRVAAGVRPANWRLAIYRRGVGNKMGNMVHSMRGVGTPPPFIKWNGRNSAGKRVLGARKQYVARFTLSTLDGSLSQSAPRVFGVGVTSVPNKVLFSRRFPGRWMGRRGIRVRGRLRRSLRRLRRKLRKLMKKPDTSLYIEVHHHNRLRRQRALFLTVRRAASLLTYMKRLLKVKEERIISQGFGSSKPKLPNITRRNRRQNLRIIVRVEQKMKPTKSSLTPLSFNAKVLLNDLSLPLDKRGRFSHTLKPPFNKKTRLRIWTPQGHHIDLSLFKLQKVPTLPRKMSHRYRFKRQWKRSLRNWRRTLRKRRQLASGKTGQHYPVLHPSVVFSKDRLLFSFKEAANHIAQKDQEARPLFSLSLASSRSKKWKRKWLAQAKAGETLRTTPPKRAAVKSKKPTQKKGVAPWKTRAGKGKTPKANAKKPKARKKPKKPQFMTVPVAKAKDVLASRLRIKLPPQGAVIRTDSIHLSGITHPTNKLKINGVDIKTDKKGHFSANVPVKHGQKKLRVVTIDTEGNKGLIEWPVAVNLNRMFLMAFAEATFGAGNNRLEGLTSIAKAEGNGLLFHGRAALYVKGQMQGKHILKKLFKKIRYTAYIDTPKRQALENFYQQLIDPERYYPIYGDSGEQVQDVKARGFRFTGPGDQQYHFPVYVLVEADRSKLLVGNFRTELKGIELNRYDRTFYGVDIDFKKRFAKHFDTRVRVFLSDGDQEQMRAHVQLRGTGGSLYYLRHSSIIEGSEQIRLTIRDKDSGIILKTIPLQRNQDYVIQYFDGRVFFKHPVTSVVDSFIITQHNLHMTLDGNPVFIEADYEHRSQEGTNGLAVGVRVQQGIYDKLKVGFTFAHEGRATGGPANYQMWGFDAQFKWNKNTHLVAEFARSSSFGTQSFFSEDGGLNFRPLQYFNQNLFDPNNPANSGAPAEGNAFLVRGQTELGELMKWKNVKVHIGGYFAHRDRGFFASGQAPEQGTTKGGALVNITLMKKHQIQLKYDGGDLLQYDLVSGKTYQLERHIGNIQYSYAFTKKLDVVIQYSHTTNYSGLDGLTLHGNFITLGANWRVHKILQLMLKQQLAFATTSRAPLVENDHFATTLGLNLLVLRSRSVDQDRYLDTYLTGTGTLRWSGNHAASIGIKSQLSETASTYIREEVTIAQQSTGLTNTLVVGASNKIGKNGRVYGEYQIDGSYSGENSRAVVGLSHLFPLWKGIFLGVGLERGQFLDPRSGNSSRTVGRVAFQLTRWKNLKASGRYELRFDDGDENRQGSDRIQFVTFNSVTWQFTKDLHFLARLNFATTFNYGLNEGTGGAEGELLEFSVGMAYRPVRYDWVQVLLKYTNRQEMRPVGLTNNSSSRTSKEVISLVPMFELPLRLQFVDQIAMKFQQENVPGMQTASSIVLLWINRLNFHLIKKLDVGLEYRFLWQWQGSGSEPLDRHYMFDHGLLIEVAYNVHKYVHVGVGYNFSSFSDNLFLDDNRDYSGFFLRVIGKF